MKENKKILAREVKPGMVIAIKRRKKYNDICLVISVSGYVEVEYQHIDYQDFYGDTLIGTIKGDTKVKVITGNERQYILEKIRERVFNHKSSINTIIDILNLIKAMEK